MKRESHGKYKKQTYHRAETKNDEKRQQLIGLNEMQIVMMHVVVFFLFFFENSLCMMSSCIFKNSQNKPR